MLLEQFCVLEKLAPLCFALLKGTPFHLTGIVLFSPTNNNRAIKFSIMMKRLNNGKIKNTVANITLLIIVNPQ